MRPQGRNIFHYHCHLCIAAAAQRQLPQRERSNINTSQVLTKGHSLCKTFSLSTFHFSKELHNLRHQERRSGNDHTGNALAAGDACFGPKSPFGRSWFIIHVISAGSILYSRADILQRRPPIALGQFLLLTAFTKGRSWRKQCLEQVPLGLLWAYFFSPYG